ncbi:MAG: tetratricopeptide repeat protein [Planctomycetota bacterium]
MAHEKIDAALETFYAGDTDGAEAALKEIGGGKLEAPAGLEPLDEAAYYEGIGGIQLAREDAKGAAEAYKKMIELEAKGEADANGHATSWAKLGEALAQTNELEEAIEAFDKAVAMKTECEAPTSSKLNVVYKYAECLFHGRKFQEAGAQFDNAIELAKEAGVDDGTMATLVLYRAESIKHKIGPMQASVRLQKGMDGVAPPPQLAALEASLDVEFKQAVELYRRAKELAAQANMPEEFQLQIQRSMSEAYHDAGRYVKGVMQRKKLIQMAEQQKVDPLELGYMYHGLGESQREMGQVPEAIESYRKSLSHKAKAGADNVSLAKTQYSLGECLAGGNKWDAAIEAFTKARDLEESSEAEDDNHKIRMKKYWNTLGMALQASGKEEEGKAAIEKAESI